MASTTELERMLATAQGSERVRILIELAFELIKSSPEQSRRHSEEAVEVSRGLTEPRYLSSALHSLGLSLFHLGLTGEALSAQREALQMRRDLGDTLGAATCQTSIGCILRQLGDYEKSLACFIEALAVEEQMGGAPGVASALNNMGNLYTVMHDYPLAIECFQRALAIHKERNDEHHISACYNNLSTVYKHLGDLGNSLRYAQQALVAKERIGHPLGIAIALHNLGLLHIEEEDYELAISELHRALDLTESLGEKIGVAMVCGSLGQAYSAAGQFDRGLGYLERGLTIAQEKEAKTLQCDILKLLTDHHADRDDFKSALDCFIRHSRLKDEMLNKEKADKIAHMRARYENEKAEREAEIYRLRNTELARAMDELKAAQENILRLERRNTLFATAVTASHEINQPLQVITGSLDLLELSVSEDDDRQKRYIRNARDSVTRIEDILVRLLALDDVEFEPYTRHDDTVSIIRTTRE